MEISQTDAEKDAFELAQERDQARAEASGMQAAAERLAAENAALRAQCRALARSLPPETTPNPYDDDSQIDVLLNIANALSQARTDWQKNPPDAAALDDFLNKTETRVRKAGWALIRERR